LDRIIIRDLQARCVLGVMEEERREKQEVLLNLVFQTDCRVPGRTDDFADAMDYRAMKRRVLALVEGSNFYLVEALAEAVAACCLEHPAVQAVTVTVDKPAALRFARSVAVEITREKTSSQ
jgi:D-erythro-7,8-dihydroneopterin triphosphate epimerase